MTEAPALLAPDEGAASKGARGSDGARGSEDTRGSTGAGTWDQRVRAALADRRPLTHSGVSAMSEDDLVGLGAALGAVRRDADRMMAVVAAEQAARSRAKASDVGLARRRGKGDERGMVSAQTGGSHAEAGRLIELGEALRDAENADAERVGAEPSSDTEKAEPTAVFPEVAKAVNAGELGVEASAMILRMLRRIAKRCPERSLAAAEKDLVSSARHMRIDRLAGLITRTEERLDREHLEELARDRRERRFLRIGETPDGMVTVSGRLDPENGAPLIAVLQAMVTQHFRLRKRMQDAARAGESVVIDERTPEQVRADAIGDFARHLAGCEVEVLPRAGVTLVVRTTLNELREGVGGASVDGLSTSLDAGALRRAAAAAGVIPQVMGGESVALNHGRRKRNFTHEQKLALVERDGGCAMCGAPPSWCDAHHIRHWARGGTTDMDNGVLLCVRCHHDIHRDDWQIHATADEVSFTPPATVDPARRKRPGGRRLFDACPLEPEPTAGPSGSDRRCALAAPVPCAVSRVAHDEDEHRQQQPAARSTVTPTSSPSAAAPRRPHVVSAMRGQRRARGRADPGRHTLRPTSRCA
ncbi:HNH endonuclease signature motif containing protein [Demequina aestuarii]|uniref:HNH endonuclease signature motif containing protein n=1 Tax=Demequina aestuarii TaxID=327095 RepID=UPI000783138F|nr:HNH endonuclease signature motif containing protein [Demequina aestuarii]